MIKDKKEVFETVIHVGESHVFYKGGIGAVLAVYEKYFPAFKAIGTHRHISGLGKILYFSGNFIRLFFTLLVNRKIRIIHIHGSYGASVLRKALIAFTGRTIFSKKIIYHIHSSEYPQKYTVAPKFHRRLIDYLLHSADRVGCLTPKWQELYIKQFGLSNTVVIPNMIHPPEFSFGSKVFPVAGQPIRFAFLGLIHEKKGVFDLIEMLAKEKANFAGKVIFHLGGIGKVEELQAGIRMHGLEDLVDFMGWVDEAGKAKLYQDVDAFFLPSYNEGLPIVILESMSYGLPIIATNVGGIPEVMEDGRNGFLFESGDIAGMKKALERYVNDHELLAEHGRNSHDMVKKFFPENVVPGIEKVYRELLDQ